MRILMLTYEVAEQGGSFIRSHSLAKALVREGHDVSLVCAAETRGLAPRQSEAGGVRIVAFPGVLPHRLLHGGLDPLDWIGRRAWCAAGSFDLVHGFGHRPTVVWTARALQRRGIPYVADWADLWGWDGIAGRRTGLSRVVLGSADQHWENRLYGRVDGLTVITRELARRARVLGAPDAQMLLLGVGADVEGIHPLPQSEMRVRHGLPEEAHVLVYVGMNPYDARMLAESFVTVARRDARALLVMIGCSLPEFESVIAEAGLGERVVRRGFVPHAALAEHLACGDVMWLPYTDCPINTGRYPNKLGDYMAAGRPTVTHPTGDLKDLVEGEGVGVLAGETPEAFATATLALLGDSARAADLGKRARQVAEEKVSWGALARRLAGFYEAVLAGGSRV